MKRKRFAEGTLEGCLGASCPTPCCDDDRVEEWVNEYFAFHERMKDHLTSHGVKIRFAGDRVRFTDCSDGKECKFLKYSLNRDIDQRPIDCKIYPFAVDWENIDFDKRIVRLYWWENDPKKFCPLVKSDAIPVEFRREVENIIKRNFAFLFYGAGFDVKFFNKPHPKSARRTKA